MEVFVHGLPTHLTEDGLKKQLESFMKRLGIFDYLCEKPKRNPHGTITFLKLTDGERFLTFHGQEEIPQTINARGRPRLKSKLQLTGGDVFCKQSSRDPHMFALKSLKHTADQREKKRQEVREEDSAVNFSLLGFSCGHCEFSAQQLVYMPELQWSDTGILKFKKRNLIVKLHGGLLIRIPLNTVIGLVWSRSGDLTLTLSTVPYFFAGESFGSPLDQMMAQMFAIKLNNNNIRNVGKPLRSQLRSLDERHAEVVGQCLVYQFKVSAVHFLEKIEYLKEWEMTIIRHDLAIPRTPASALSAFPIQLQVLMKELAEYTRNNSLPFGILFQLQALAYNAYLTPITVVNIPRELRRLFKVEKSTGNAPVSVDAIKKLFDMIDWPFPEGNPEDYKAETLVAQLKQIEDDIRLGFAQREGLVGPTQNFALIHKVMVTPTRITLHGPELEPKNRILRKFPNHHDFFIRVHFCDENGNKLHFGSQISYDDIFSRFKDVLTNGIQIAGRTYSFLGWSHSSLRSHSIWFSSPFMDDNGHLQTYFSIIKALGDFSKITSPARCAARIGQAFSETPFAISLADNDIHVLRIEDVTSSDGKRVFSDGVGKISWAAAETIRHHIPAKNGKPTCFQIRLGGAKGMLAVDTRLPGSLIQIRPSMIKFNGEMKDLEICDMAAKPIPLVLNRQVIKILEDMGVSGDWFFKLQEAELRHLRSITASAHNTAVFIKKQNIGDSIGLFRLFRQCHRLKIDYRKEPFLRSLVEAVVLRELRLLKHKARIPVQEGITLFGIMDETGFLEHNQVYVTFDTMDGRHSPPPDTGRLLVTRSPALHDGDLQFAHNIVPPEDHPLTRHRNCIVFSKNGLRDLPSQLSGGDLDGDIYNIIWDPDARPIRVFQPADYPRVQPVNMDRPVNKDDMAEFFIDFMRTDILGVIATRHMILADQRDQGTSDPDCRMLAQLHSTAVDFSKTGIPVQLNELPRFSKYRPDFLAPGPQAYIYKKSQILMDEYVVQEAYDEDDDSEPPRKYYRSEKILGKLYRAIDERKIWHEDVHSKISPDGDSFWDEFIRSSTARCNAFGPIMWTHRTEEAGHIRSAYEDAVFSARNNYSEHPINPISELEVFIGSVMNKGGVQTRRQRDQSTKLSDEFERITTWIMGLMHRHHSVTIPRATFMTNLDTVELCLACVHVGGKQNHGDARRRRDEYGELESFRVVAACALLAELDLFEKGRKEGIDRGLTGKR